MQIYYIIVSLTLQLAIALQVPLLPQDAVCRLSVCLSSVTRVYSDKTAEATIRTMTVGAYFNNKAVGT